MNVLGDDLVVSLDPVELSLGQHVICNKNLTSGATRDVAYAEMKCPLYSSPMDWIGSEVCGI